MVVTSRTGGRGDRASDSAGGDGAGELGAVQRRGLRGGAGPARGPRGAPAAIRIQSSRFGPKGLGSGGFCGFGFCFACF